MKKIVIAGGGISGLSARYYLSKRYPNADIVLFEKSGRLGGCIESVSDPYFFETGPRTIKASRSGELLKLIEDLDLKSEVVYSSKHAKRRYLWIDQKLRTLPSLIRPLIPALLKEWRQPYPWEGDESIASFVERRLGKYAAETFFDPITLGIFAGDIHNLSISACFPELKAMEREFGSLTRALFKKKKKKKQKGLFTLIGGLQTLIDRLVERGRGEIHLNTPLESLNNEHTILALPAPAAANLFQEDSVVRAFFLSVPSVSLTVVNIAFKEKVLNREGFGYLVPSKEKEEIMGVVFDSSLFPNQNREGETRLTAFLRQGGEEEALSGLQRHLGIQETPTTLRVKTYPHAVPQYRVGHLKRVETFENHLKQHYPHVTCIGNYLRGVSLNACVRGCFSIASLV